jgi:hypothetical protein
MPINISQENEVELRILASLGEFDDVAKIYASTRTRFGQPPCADMLTGRKEKYAEFQLAIHLHTIPSCTALSRPMRK